MGFVTLERNGPAAAPTVPDKGVVISTRIAGRAATRKPYMAIKIGAALARDLGCHLGEQRMRVQAGNGDDAGKIAISCDMKSKFTAKKQTGGYYLLTVPGGSLDGHVRMPDNALVVENARFVPANAGNGPMAIVMVGKP